MRRWSPILVGRQLTQYGLALGGIKIRLLLPPGRIHQWAFRLCRTMNLPYPPSLLRLRKIGASLIHVHFGTNAVDIWPLVRVLKIPLLVTLHGYDITVCRSYWETGRGGWHRRRYPYQLLELADDPNVHFIAVSNAIRMRALDLGIPAHKVTVHHIGVDTDMFRPSSVPVSQRRRRIVFVGRLVEQKGLAYLIRAFVTVQERIPDAELVIIGTGPLRGNLERLARNLNVPARFLGALSNDEVRNEINKAQVLCLPSITTRNGETEGFGIVILEAQACGVPVVTSSYGGAGEGVVNGKTGFSFPEGDESILARRLVTLLANPDELNHFSAAAVEFVRSKFDLNSLTASLEDLYDVRLQANE